MGTMSKDHRREIVQRIASLAFQGQKDALTIRRKAMSLEIHAIVVPADTKAVLAALPEHFRPPRKKSYTVEDTLDSGLRFDVNLDESDFVPDKWRTEVTLDKDIASRIRQLQQDESDMHRRMRDMVSELTKNVEHARTTKRLIELWPEAKSIVLEVCEELEAVETPLSALLGRFLPALPAPATETTTA